ncbi:MAG: heme-binding domain-containing protein [Sulfuricurvum sp.]|nr:heme-binding domain-containing protein [Sulfuricurvum sp.]
MKTKILAGLAVVAIAIQFIPYGKDHTNPLVISEPQWDSPRTKELFTNACANCHSNQTTYPWYSDIAPLSWLIEYDVKEGRELLNVSVWGVQKKNEGNEAAKEVREGEMPPFYYLPTHPEAKLTDAQKQALITGLEKTFGKESPEEKEKN